MAKESSVSELETLTASHAKLTALLEEREEELKKKVAAAKKRRAAAKKGPKKE